MAIMFDSMLPSGGMLIFFAPRRPISSGKMVSWNYVGSFTLQSLTGGSQEEKAILSEDRVILSHF